jgi:hypothetical protein
MSLVTRMAALQAELPRENQQHSSSVNFCRKTHTVPTAVSDPAHPQSISDCISSTPDDSIVLYLRLCDGGIQGWVAESTVSVQSPAALLHYTFTELRHNLW